MSHEESTNIIRLLIHHPSFDVNRPLTRSGDTALMLLVQHGRADLVRELLEVPGINRNQRNNVSVKEINHSGLLSS
jgi:ankyrin repeat protein